MMSDTTEVDLVNRDPNSINSHIQVDFEDVLAEPENVRSMDCVWKSSYKCFNLWKNLCYTILTLMCGICYAVCWGCAFAEVAFYHIWYLTPCIKILEINCGSLKKIFRMFLSCCLDPICESFGMLFHNFRKS